MWALTLDGETYSTHATFEEAWEFRRRHDLDACGRVEHVELQAACEECWRCGGEVDEEHTVCETCRAWDFYPLPRKFAAAELVEIAEDE